MIRIAYRLGQYIHIRAPIMLLVSVVAGAFQTLQPPFATAQVCLADTIGIGSSLADGSGGAVFGEAPGQTFYATDTLMTFLRAWRVAAEDSNVIGMRLHLMTTLQSGVPNLSNILVDGPTLVRRFGDGINPIEFMWRWDPPLVLPGRGLYAWFLTQDPCSGLWDILAKSDGAYYLQGDAWYTPRSNCVIDPPTMQPRLRHFPNADFVFQVGFCRDATTSVRRSNWGALKMLYR